MIRLLLLLLIILFAGQESFAQRETDNWYFGQNASLEFNAAGVPVSFNNSAMNTAYGSASISDRAGNLLFYTNGDTVWNRLHQVMVNGIGLQGRRDLAQNSIIIPKPGSSTHYYIFTKDWNPNNTMPVLAYSEVDMAAANGNGAVINTTKNTALLGATSDYQGKITAVHHANGRDIWVITVRITTKNLQEVVAFKVTANGIDPNPVTTIETPPYFNWGNHHGCIKASPDGKRLAVAFGQAAWVYNFNSRTGKVTNALVIPPVNNPPTGLEFSPDGSKLYISYAYAFDTINTVAEIRQYNLALSTNQAIINSRTIIAQTQRNACFLQLATNGKIYSTHGASSPGSTSLMEIANPNAAGLACNYRQGPILAAGTRVIQGLPNFIQSYFAPPRFNFTGICAESPTVFTIPDLTNIDSVKWNFDDPVAGTQNVSSQLSPSHTFSLGGNYLVKLTIYQQGFESFFERQVTVLNKPRVQLYADTSVCEGTPVLLINLNPPNPFNERWVWSTGNRDSTVIKVTKPGVYWLELTNGVCTARDSIVITHRPVPMVDLGANQAYCGNEVVTLDAGNPGATYNWQPNGEKTQTITVTKSGIYSVAVTSNRCTGTGAVSIEFNTPLEFELGNDITVCEGEPVTLKTIEYDQSIKYLWSDGSKWPEIEVKKSGRYWARVTQNGCVFTDTINVTFKECPPPIVPYIPNIISPNNDNINDKLEIKKIPLNSWSLKIYNRWGQEIYTSGGYGNNWPERPVMDGTYYYILEEPETNRKFKGWVEVVR